MKVRVPRSGTYLVGGRWQTYFVGQTIDCSPKTAQEVFGIASQEAAEELVEDFTGQPASYVVPEEAKPVTKSLGAPKKVKGKHGTETRDRTRGKGRRSNKR